MMHHKMLPSRRGRSGWAVPLLLTAAGLAAPGETGAAVQPSLHVLLLLDTQDEMNLEPVSRLPASCADPVQKSAWIHVQEALAGTLDTFTCELQTVDLPGAGLTTFPQLTAGSHFLDDGLLLQYEERVRFGAMFMDALRSPDDEESGGYSYGKTVRFAGQDLNLGARHPLAARGPLISFDFFAEATSAQHNARLVQVLRGLDPLVLPTFPAGIQPLVPGATHGSPAALLADAQGFLESYAQDDPQDGCRTRVAFLVSSGKADPELDPLFSPDPGPGPYDTAEVQARSLLVNQQIRTHVFYFSDGQPLTRERMDRIAAAGGTEEAHEVSSGPALRAAMSEALNELLAGTRSSTGTSSSYQTFAPQISQIQSAAAYTLPGAGRWYGHLEYTTYKCYDERPFQAIDLARQLDTGGQRRIVTPLGGETRAVAYSADDPAVGLTPAVLGLPEDQAAGLVDYLEGLDNVFSPLPEHKLGAIVHSNPQLVGAPNMELPFASYMGSLQGKESFKVRNLWRPTMLYVGANDGMLHGFAVAVCSEAGHPDCQGDLLNNEVFAFIPRALHPSLRLLGDPSTPSVLLDGSPIVRDVRLRSGPGITPEQERWATVLIGGGRMGGRYYYALNVSEPRTFGLQAADSEGIPTFLWELDAADPEADPVVQQHLGHAWGRPAVGSVVIEENGQLQEVAVAFVPGGKAVEGLAGTGKAFWVVQIEPRNGANRLRPRLLASFHPDDPLNRVGDELTYPISGTPAAYGSIPGQPTNRVFVGDEGGRLWRIDTSSTSPAQWTMKVFHDPYAGADPSLRRPVHFEPSLSLRPSGELVVVYGTGNSDQLEHEQGNHRLVSLTEKLQYDDQGRPTAEAYDPPNFVLPFQPGEQLTSPTLIFDSTVFFGTYRHDATNPCQQGETRLWGVDYVGKDPLVSNDVVRRFPTLTQTSVVNPGSVWEESAAPSCQEESPDGMYGKSSLYCVMPPGTLISGVEITRSPACHDFFEDDGLDDEQPAAADKLPLLGKPVLTVQSGNSLPIGLLGMPRNGASAIGKLRRYLNQPRVSTMPLMWGSVYDE